MILITGMLVASITPGDPFYTVELADGALIARNWTIELLPSEAQQLTLGRKVAAALADAECPSEGGGEIKPEPLEPGGCVEHTA
jgi:hypothetical protein